MADETFIQRSRFGKCIFSIRREHLEISSYMLGRASEARIALTSISADYDLRAHRSWRVLIILLAVAALLCTAAWLILRHSFVPHTVAVYLLGFAGFSFFAAYRFIPRLEYFAFKDHWGRRLFSIVREPEQADECNDFVHHLLDRLEQREPAANDPSQAARSATAASAVRVESAGLPLDNVRWWSVAIVFGGVAALYPLLALPDSAWRMWSFPIVVVSSGFSVSVAIWSFVVKEPKRIWSLLGLVLCAVPMLFYWR